MSLPVLPSTVIPSVLASFGRVVLDRAVLCSEEQSQSEVLRVANSKAADRHSTRGFDSNPAYDPED